MYRRELRPEHGRASVPILRLPRRYHLLPIERITVTDHQHVRYGQHLNHLTVEDLPDAIRVQVTLEPQTRVWSHQRRRSAPYSKWQERDGSPGSSFRERIAFERHVMMPQYLRGVNGQLDALLLHRFPDEPLAGAAVNLGIGDKTMPVYGPGRFTWVPPAEPYQAHTTAYREVRKADMPPEAREVTLVDIVNVLLGPPLYIRHATAEVLFVVR